MWAWGLSVGPEWWCCLLLWRGLCSCSDLFKSHESHKTWKNREAEPPVSHLMSSCKDSHGDTVIPKKRCAAFHKEAQRMSSILRDDKDDSWSYHMRRVWWTSSREGSGSGSRGSWGLELIDIFHSTFPFGFAPLRTERPGGPGFRRSFILKKYYNNNNTNDAWSRKIKLFKSSTGFRPLKHMNKETHSCEDMLRI